ncbi:MAG: VTT domain-containing protein [Alphaproteobacteria bacterium]|jgi:uncharacterized membrane protein YdjX (TVP38/TMEM64 family)|nr:VTT domain-containing protein [Alphaproteobacteria bacterium]
MDEHKIHAVETALDDEIEEWDRRVRFRARNLVPLAVLVAGLVAFLALGFDEYVSFETLRERRAWLMGEVDRLGFAAALIFMAIYVAAIAFSIPGALVLTLTGGFLFGTGLGVVYSVLSATLGATIVFTIAKSALGDPLRQRAGPWLERMAEGFQENAFCYLLVLRMIPIFPFWVVNLVPAFLGMRLGHYAAATLVGVIPASFIITVAGAGLGGIFDSGEAFSLSSVLTPEIIFALVGLAALVLVPLIYRKLKGR